MKRVSKDEFNTFLCAYPRQVATSISEICKPPALNYYDFSLPENERLIAHTFKYDEDPESPMFVPENEHEYYIKE